ncbi:MAG: hypothetical protein ACT4QD_13160 [Acidobacteriota bacterium]
MTIREIAPGDRADWARLREALWPGSPSAHDDETHRYFEERLRAPVVFVAAHLAVGFEEVERVACFRRSLREA